MSELRDSAARSRIRTEFDKTFFVEAAAGTGKTTALVGRIVAMVRLGHGALASTVAVTFTEKAAGEMKLRLRLEIETARVASKGDERRRLDLALEELELARIGTIHSFCADLLRERPVEAGVDPLFKVLQEKEASALIDVAFDRWLERALEAPPEGVRRVLRRRGGKDTAQELLRAALKSLSDHRDFPHPWRRDPFYRDGAIDEIIEEMKEVGKLATESSDEGPPLTKCLGEIAAFVAESTRLEHVQRRDHDVLEASLRDLQRLRSWKHKGWARTTYGGLTSEEAAARRDSAKARLDAFVAAADADLAPLLQQELQAAVLEYERLKADAGALDFLDLLIKARDLVRDDPEVRRDLQNRFLRFFVDEAQDTDPLQAELLLLLTSDDPDTADWRAAKPAPGKLFLVGDPKQSLYRFRRADVRLYESIKASLLAEGAELLHLSSSFRSPPSLQRLVNAAFAGPIASDAEAGGYVQLEEVRSEIDGQPTIVALPVPDPYGEYGKITNAAIDASTPTVVAAFIDWLVHRSGWKVLESGRRVDVRPRHVALLFRRLRYYGTDVPRPYLKQLEARHIPHVLVGGRSFHDREEVIALRTALVAIEWPDDELAVFATLRGPFFSIGDEALLVFRQQIVGDSVVRRRLDPLRSVDRETLDPVAAEVATALEVLRQLHFGRNDRPIAQTIAMFLDAVRAHAGIALWQNGEQALANCQRLVDQARSFERRASSFRAFVEQIEDDAERGEVDDAPVIEEGTEGVRAMTVHKAKGLDFPVVILVDPTANPVRQTADRHVDPARGLWLERLCGSAPIELQEAGEVELQRDRAESVRLAYVAATRARDLLVVPTCGDQPIEGWFDVLNQILYPSDGERRSALFADGCPEFGDDSVRSRGRKGKMPAGGSVQPGRHKTAAGSTSVVWWDPKVLSLDVEASANLRHQRLLEESAGDAGSAIGAQAYAAWKSDRGALIEIASRRGHVVQTVTARASITAHSSFDIGAVSIERVEGDLDRRLGGRRFGTLVHSVLAAISFEAVDSELGRLVDLHGRLLAVTPEERAAAVRTVRQVLLHPTMQRAARANDVRRELPIITRLTDGSLVEGVMDLAFHEADPSFTGWTVVDFKTTRQFDAENVPEQYVRQVALYCEAMSASMRSAARGVVLVV
jgi:ATP-dependent helicase/nuclease subunit A